MSEKLSKKLCKCLEKEKITSVDDMNPCFEKVLIKNLEEIYKVYNIKTLEEFDMDKLSIDIGVKLMKECDYAMQNLIQKEAKFADDFVPDANLDCSELKSGDFYYLIPNSVTKVSDTTFVTIKNDMYLERMKSGRSYSLLKIKWVDDCKFNLIFQDSNDKIKAAMSNPGDIYNYETVSSTPNSFIIKLNWRKQEFRIELFKAD